MELDFDAVLWFVETDCFRDVLRVLTGIVRNDDERKGSLFSGGNRPLAPRSEEPVLRPALKIRGQARLPKLLDKRLCARTRRELHQHPARGGLGAPMTVWHRDPERLLDVPWKRLRRSNL